MIFAVGQRVRLKYTGEIGVIEQLAEGIAQIRLSDGDLIPTPLENLSDPEAVTTTQKLPVKGTYQGPIPISADLDHPTAVYLLFDLVNKGGPFEYGLLNLTGGSALISCQLQFKSKVVRKKNEKIGPMQYVALGNLSFSELGHQPGFHLQAWPVESQGSGKSLEKKVKIKVSQFFAQAVPIEDLGEGPFRLYQLLKDFSQEEKPALKGLKKYTQENIKWDHIERVMEKNVIAEKAVFPIELDLHIEKLTTFHDKLSNLEILKIQIRHFEKYLSDAIKLGVDHVYIIHGLGKGRLREEIHTRLNRYPQVREFKNEYHPLYGWGATEIKF
ncbi:MAG: Smr/MutS family protein [Saprospiraceae bacterium]|nr:Smr/MutS family protein [Saprospiraceae bacterium]